MTKLPLGVKNMPSPGGTVAGDGVALSIKLWLSNGNRLKIDVHPPLSEYVVMTEGSCYEKKNVENSSAKKAYWSCQ